MKCKDGSRKFTRDQLNDEFCDCPDGTDEPGTSACPEGKFYCRNVGHAPLVIFSSRINDGICDCCDGSDEYDGKVNCSNTCWEAGKAARDKLKKKIATFQDGVIIRNKEVEKAKLAIAKEEEELSKLKNEEKSLKDLVSKLKEQKERIEKAEKEEQLKKELEEKRLKEDAEKEAAKAKESIEASLQVEPKDANKEVPEASSEAGENGMKTELPDEGALHEEYNKELSRESPAQKFAKMTGNMDEEIRTGPAEGKTDSDESSELPEQVSDDSSSDKSDAIHSEGQESGSASTEGLSKEELGRLVASRWTGEKPAEKVETPKDDSQKEHTDELAEPAGEEENYDSYNSEMEDDRHKYKDEEYEHKSDDEYDESDDEYSDDHTDTVFTDSYKSDDEYKSDHSDDISTHGGLTWIDKIQQTIQRVFQSFNFFKTPVDLSEASRVKKEYEDMNSKLSKIQSRISHLKEKLEHDFGKDKEFYSFYDQCFENKQNKYVYKVCPYKKATQNEGHSSTQLGRWDKFEDSYRVMIFSNGDHCWNGPNRSLKVRLRCGLKNEVADVDEPSRCEYVAILSTPAMCVEDRLKELKQKLADMSASSTSHDEL